jgi:hypothetical protein
MKTNLFRISGIAACLVYLSLLVSQSAPAQAPDSSRAAPGNALQFQIVGGVGVYYISGGSGSTFYRIGADASIHSANSSGTQEGRQDNTGSLGSTSGGPTDQTSSSIQVSVSGLWLMTIAEYSHTSLYVGLGPVGTYSNDKSSYGSTNNYTYPGGSYGYTDINSYSNTKSAWGLGPLALIGIRARAFNLVTNLSAQYQWTSTTYTSTQTYVSPSPSVNVDSGSSKFTGWAIDLRSIQIGVAIDI